MSGDLFRAIKARDLKGMSVRLLCKIQSRGGSTFKMGHVMKIEKKHGTLNLACPDGCKERHSRTGGHRITGVSIYHVELL